MSDVDSSALSSFTSWLLRGSLRCYFLVILRVPSAWVLHFYAGLPVFANAHGGARSSRWCRLRRRQPRYTRALASTAVNDSEHHRE